MVKYMCKFFGYKVTVNDINYICKLIVYNCKEKKEKIVLDTDPLFSELINKNIKKEKSYNKDIYNKVKINIKTLKKCLKEDKIYNLATGRMILRKTADKKIDSDENLVIEDGILGNVKVLETIDLEVLKSKCEGKKKKNKEKKDIRTKLLTSKDKDLKNFLDHKDGKKIEKEDRKEKEEITKEKDLITLDELLKTFKSFKGREKTTFLTLLLMAHKMKYTLEGDKILAYFYIKKFLDNGLVEGNFIKMNNIDVNILNIENIEIKDIPWYCNDFHCNPFLLKQLKKYLDKKEGCEDIEEKDVYGIVPVV